MSRKAILVLLGVGLGLLAVLTWAAWRAGPEPDARPGSAHVPAKRDGHAFGGDDVGVIDVGVQPLWVPASAIAEVMRRDEILREELARLGFSIRFHPFFKGQDILDHFFRGHLDGAMTGDMPALMAVVSPPGSRLPAIINQGRITLLSNRGYMVRDLRGKAIGVAPGASAHFCLLKMLAREGLTDQDVHLVFMDIVECPAALAEGRIAAFASWEPNTTIFMRQDSRLVVLHRSRYSGFIFFNAAFSSHNIEAERVILASLIRSMIWMIAGKENLSRSCGWAIDAARSLTGIDQNITVDEYAEIVKREWLDHVPVPSIPDDDARDGGRFYEQFMFLKQIGKIPPTAEWRTVQDALDLEAVKYILTEARRYRIREFSYSR